VQNECLVSKKKKSRTRGVAETRYSLSDYPFAPFLPHFPDYFQKSSQLDFIILSTTFPFIPYPFRILLPKDFPLPNFPNCMFSFLLSRNSSSITSEILSINSFELLTSQCKTLSTVSLKEKKSYPNSRPSSAISSKE